MVTRILAPCPGRIPGRFHVASGLAEDALTGLLWPVEANPLGFPLTWTEALAAAARLGRERYLGRADWRVPNRRELRSLVDHGARNPALPAEHPFAGVFLGWYWTNTTKAGLENYAWNLHLEGGRLFYSRKDEERLLWPVAGGDEALPRTGQMGCFDAAGRGVPCEGSGQDGELRLGAVWPEPRFTREGNGLRDGLTHLVWLAPELLSQTSMDWETARAAARAPAMRESAAAGNGWRLPNINELESLVDAAWANPALPSDLPGRAQIAGEGYWSATTSGFDADWAFVLYAQKGAVGVGFKSEKEFRIWPVRGPENGTPPQAGKLSAAATR